MNPGSTATDRERAQFGPNQGDFPRGERKDVRIEESVETSRPRAFLAARDRKGLSPTVQSESVRGRDDRGRDLRRFRPSGTASPRLVCQNFHADVTVLRSTSNAFAIPSKS